MLVLTRRIGEEMVIAGNIRVAVVGVKGSKVRLGITAPTSVPVTRLELLANCPGGADPANLACPPVAQTAQGASR
jgi:carbon storage regulator